MMKKKHLVISAFLILPACAFMCKSSQIQETASKSDIAGTYAPYEKLQGDFVISGKMTGKTFSYNGKINVENRTNPPDFSLFMIVRDMIFQSPLSSMQIKNSRILFNDIVNHIEKEYSYKESSFAFYSNQEIPMEVMIPLFAGNLPDGLLTRGKHNAEASMYRLSTKDYELVGFFKNSHLTTLIYNPPENYFQITFEISGVMQNAKNRYFPAKIKVSLAKDEYFEIEYKQINIQ